jgi:hypothetical protein
MCPNDLFDHEIECPAGTAQPSRGELSCIPCASQSFSNMSGSSLCHPCATAFYTPPNSTSCGTECSSEYYHSNGNCVAQVVCDIVNSYYVYTGAKRECVNYTTALCDVKRGPFEPCSVGGVLKNCRFRAQYLKFRLNGTNDRICVPSAPCGNNSYMYREALTDTSGLLLVDQQCRPYTECNTDYYYTVRGRTTENRDNVCTPYTTCGPTEYESSPASTDADRKCEIRTTCSNMEYILAMGGNTTNNVCQKVTQCASGMFESLGAIDAWNLTSNGTDASCQNYSNCTIGSGVAIPGTAKTDVICMVCAAGTLGNGLSCENCPIGTFSAPNNSVCTPCNICAGQNYSALCNSTSDSICLASCPHSWILDNSTGLCQKCAVGYFERDAVYECIQCPANYYCPSKHEPDKQACPDNSTSTPGSHIATLCQCNSAGGSFGNALGLLGCLSCPAGSYAPPSSTSTPCSLCPNHTYSYAGSANCTACPTETPYTHRDGCGHESDCHECPEDQYFNADSECTACGECSTLDYQVTQCTSRSPRVCAPCIQLCDIDQEPQWCDNSNAFGSGCKMCNVSTKPPHSRYVRNETVHQSLPLFCLWECDTGFFMERDPLQPTVYNCKECTVRNESNCPVGMTPRDCTTTQDFSCNVPCVSDTKPLQNSIWLQQCKWSCNLEYEAITTPTGLWFCRLV